MSPFEHAEVFVLDDSGEFVIEKERRGDYGRGEAIEDLTKALEFETNSADILHERGDIESMPFIEALLEPVAAEPNLKESTARKKIYDRCDETVRIPMVGKYTGLSDAYLSVLKDPEAYKVAWNILKGVDGVLVPRGFGDGGVQGKILATKYAGEHSVPFLGICLGMQIVVNE
ncbi:uncharacterized protein HKW66_Vig0202910 [Vigna angularis]|uniref:CTP synthase (glutamine hydrolyzing) n=1 Tax=Phaseolus angularis TaxID=3914 RepID=A0A8T0JRQ6_PHAAN|nr:uncharacterized protein HKW66_Vig0202910 [Vigna angularis]